MSSNTATSRSRNLRRLERLHARGDYGFYDAIDYTDRTSGALDEAPILSKGEGAIVYQHLAHHQGMTLVAIANALLGDVMVERFHPDHAEPGEPGAGPAGHQQAKPCRQHHRRSDVVAKAIFTDEEVEELPL